MFRYCARLRHGSKSSRVPRFFGLQEWQELGRAPSLLALEGSPNPIIFVIDALDECGGQLTDNGTLDDADTHRIDSDMLEALVTISRATVRLPVKFFVTSRPETHNRDMHVSDVTFSKVLRLHAVDKQQVAADIRLYIYFSCIIHR